MSNVQDIRNFIPNRITLGGKERTLRYDMNAYAELEKRYGSVEAAMEQLEKGSIKDVKVMLWAGLIHDEVKDFDEDGEPTGYNITPYMVGKWISTPSLMAEASEALGEALSDGMPKPEETEVKNK